MRTSVAEDIIERLKRPKQRSNQPKSDRPSATSEVCNLSSESPSAPGEAPNRNQDHDCRVNRSWTEATVSLASRIANALIVRQRQN